MNVKIKAVKKMDMYPELIADNKDEVSAANYRLLIRLDQITGILMVIVAVIYAGFFGNRKLLPAYGFGFTASVSIFCLNYTSLTKKHPLICLYFLSTVYILIAIYMSLYKPAENAVIIVGVFCVIPMIFIDRPLRIDLYVVLFCVIHAVLALIFKERQIAIGDIINSSSFVVVGLYIGHTVMYARLSEKDVRRRAELEKITDVLSGINNRRRLFEHITILESPEVEKPTGALMFDIDKFKDFNDRFGHAAGDECLQLLGRIMRNLEKKYNGSIVFYRYGGDEFAGFVYGMNRNALELFSRELQKEVSILKVNGQSINISTGAVYCGTMTVDNYEKVIESADTKLYEAKQNGRNQFRIGDYTE